MFHHYVTTFKLGIVDSSGLKFTYLETPREHNAGILFMGHSVVKTMIIPPNAANYTISAFCSENCTTQVHVLTNNFYHACYLHHDKIYLKIYTMVLLSK